MFGGSFSTIAEAGSHMRLPLLSLPPFSSSMGEMAHHPLLAMGGTPFLVLNEYFFELNPRKNPVLNNFFELNPRKNPVLNNIFELNFFRNPKMNKFLN